MSTIPVLALPDFSKPFILEIYDSTKAIGAVLMQQGRPLAYQSQALGIRNKGLSIYEKELLFLIIAVTKCRHYLLGSHFIIKTDHESLKYLIDQKISIILQQRWITKLLGLDYEIQIKRGKENIVADALSGKQQLEEASQGFGELSINAVMLTKSTWLSKVTNSYAGDPKARELLMKLAVKAPQMPAYS
ncbi:hypothetical protein ACH5RR_023453 [Cinchona calisaya]|uniref:Reverse transcriptase RNase H-like domain-containing protein n=1 Tax=Cinchona calisaya TaxID=153742 RepID=A0ABD2ZCL3_9GENT